MKQIDEITRKRVDGWLKILNAQGNHKALKRYYKRYLNSLEGLGDKLSFRDWNQLWAQVAFIGQRLSQGKGLPEAALELLIEACFGETFKEFANPPLLEEYWGYFLENSQLLKRLGICKNCATWFYRKHLGMRHCSSRCRNAYRTRCYRQQKAKRRVLS